MRTDLEVLPGAPSGRLDPVACSPRARIAVIGSGVAGLAAAYTLNDAHDVTLYEAADRAGGHAKTVTVDYDGTPVAADVGFMVFAPAIYPGLSALFKRLGVKSRLTSMSFGVSEEDGFEWSWTGKRDPRGWLRNGLSTERRRLFTEILRFNGLARDIARNDPAAAMPFREFMAVNRFSPRFAHHYGLPLVSAIWSLPAAAAAEFPTGRLCTFLDRHKLLNIRAHRWRSIVGGSETYVEPLVARIGTVRLCTPVKHVARLPDGGVRVRDGAGGDQAFDAAVFATHPDETLAIMGDADSTERAVLGAIRYHPNNVVLHRDPGLMPRSQAEWACWNVGLSRSETGAAQSAVSYWLNRLQGVPRRMPLFVTVNPPRQPAPGRVFGEWQMAHFQLDAKAVAAQGRLPAIQGRGSLWHCGSWTGDGFHEDGFASGLSVAADIARSPVAQRAATAV